MTRALFHYSLPDESTPAALRSFYSFPASRLIKEEYQELHDFRNATDLAKGANGLDVQGFTYVSHHSALNGDEWFAKNKIEANYLDEITTLICNVTGASRAIVDGVSIRKKLAKTPKAAEMAATKGSDLDIAIGQLPRDQVRVTGRQEGTSTEPARICHIDYTLTGLKNTVRWCRSDLREAAQHVLEAEDRKDASPGETVSVPRYAAYSVWRPLAPIQRDPLAVLDWRTTDPSEIVSFESRALSAISDTGEYLRESAVALPPKSPGAQRWYWMPNQRPDEVLIIKFADTEAHPGSGIASGCVHCSPEVCGIDENAPVRSSVECRVFAFWD